MHGRASNPVLIAKHYGQGSDAPRVSRGDLLDIIRSELSFRPTWAGGPRPYGAFLTLGTTTTPWMLAVVAVAVAAAAVRRAWDEIRGIAVAAIGLVTAYVSIGQITGPIGSWYLLTAEATSIALAALALASLLRSTWAAAVTWGPGRAEPAPSSPRRRLERRHLDLALGALAIGSLVAAAATLRQPQGELNAARAADHLRPVIEQRIGRNPVLLEVSSGYGGWVQSALALHLERAGHDVFARTPVAGKYPAAVEARPPDDAVRLVFVTDPARDITWTAGVEVVAEASFRLAPGEQPFRIVVVAAPLDSPFLSVASKSGAAKPSGADQPPTGGP